MARCPKCRRYFREPEDEQGEHDCPFSDCGWRREWRTEEEEEHNEPEPETDDED